MKTVNIGYANHLDYFNYLPEKVVFENEFTENVTVNLQSFETSNDTTVYDYFYSANKVDSPKYDLLLHPAGTFENASTLPGVYNLPVINKLYNGMYIAMIAKKYPNLGINSLHFFRPYFDNRAQSRKTNIGEIDTIKFMIDKGYDFIIKPIFGARSYGISDMPKEVVVKWPTLNRLFVEDEHAAFELMRDLGVDIPDEKHFGNSNFIIQEKAKVRYEFRILKIWDKLYSMQREPVGLGKPLGQISGYKPIEEEKLLISRVDNLKLIASMLHSQIPVGSMDLFIDEDNRIGFFEYNAQFAIDKMEPEMRRKICKDIVLGYLKDNLELLQLEENVAYPLPSDKENITASNSIVRTAIKDGVVVDPSIPLRSG